MAMAWRSALLCVFLLSGCGDDVPPAGDAGVRADAGPYPSACAAPSSDLGAGACLRDADCPGSVCRADTSAPVQDLAPLSLLCAEPDSAAAPGAPCAEGADCDRGLCVLAGACVAPCGGAADCGSEERCARVYVRTGPTALQPVFACVPVMSLSADVTATRVALPGALGSAVADIGIEGTGPTTLAILRPDCGLGVRAVSLRTRDATPVTLWMEERSGEPWINPVAPTALPLTILIANSPGAAVSTAGYALGVEATGTGGATLTTLHRARTGGDLDLDLYYVGGRGWVPEGTRGPPDVAGAVGQLEVFFARAGIRVGQVRQHEVVGGLRDRYGVLNRASDGRYPELQELFSLTAGTPGPSVSVFFVRSLDGALGLSGGLPGPAGMHGVEGSGLAIGVDVLASISLLELALAHEVGHHLGLFHTTEPDGRVIEPLPGTPECGIARDIDANGVLDAEECTGAGGDNLMFWAAAGAVVSDDQLEVLSRAFVLR